MAVELFGQEIAPYAAVACVISFLMTGERSVFSKQKISFIKDLSYDAQSEKSKDMLVSKRRRPRKASLVRLVRHLVPKAPPRGNETEK
jgi:hypothetical protein